MDWFFYAVALPIAVLFLASAVYAFFWSSRNGQLKDFEKGAASIFDEEEPIGRPTDAFPAKTPRRPRG
jgi:cbb3-type cytochrome oxidase maturation protein